MNWLTKHLVPDWHEAYKWLSIHGATILTVASTIYAYSGAFQSIMSPTMFGWFTAALGVTIIGLRLLNQEPTK